MIIKTERLLLRPWEDADLESFAQLNADPRVMEFFLGVKTFEETKNEYLSIKEHFRKYGWGPWAATVDGKFIGFIGLMHVGFTASFTPAVEVGWRLAYDTWGKGYATEGALEAIKYGFDVIGLDEIVSFTAVHNMRSRRVMDKIGMYHDEKNDFDHPKLPAEHNLCRHVLYRIQKGGSFVPSPS